MVAEAVNVEPVPCGKCGRVNAASARRCVHCEAHLHVACRKCGAVNERAARRCHECGKRLHRSAWSRWRRRVGERVKAREIVLVVVVSLLFAYLLLKLNRRDSSQPSVQVEGVAPGKPDFRQ